MKKMFPLFLLMLAVCQSSFAGDPVPEGFRPLFNGKDLTGWHGMPTYDPAQLAGLPENERNELLQSWNADILLHWKVENGVIINDGHGAYLTTDESFNDYEFLVDYQQSPKADSGIYLKNTPQVQIWDLSEEGGGLPVSLDKASGGLWNNSPGSPGKDPLVIADKPVGEWNRMRIRQLGDRTSVWLNDQLVVDHAILENYFDRSRPLAKAGEIQLQTHGAEMHWKNLFIRQIPVEEANQILAEKSGEGFERIFNGKDLNGWKGIVDSYDIVDGALVAKKGINGVLYREEEYTDFAVRLEFKLAPKGNNGLAIRFSGEGIPAFDGGLCEVQMLDSEHPDFHWIDPRQAHGSIYGKIPAARGYLRETGEWNFQEVTVKGSVITVELNGVIINKGDVSQVTEFMAGHDHIGKDRTSGYFGFVGHDDPVSLRNIEIKRLQ